ncbi:MAG: DinB family protein [Bacteroidota bacterium]
MITKPDISAVPDYFVYYTGLVQENDLIEALAESREATVELFSSIPVEKEDFAYAPGKWTVKQMLSHLIDTERVFAYRALRFSRHDSTELPGYDENLFARNSNTENLMLERLLEEYRCVRKSTLSLFETMSDEMLDFQGTANKMSCSARALGYMIAGHEIHHCNVLKERYL